MNAKYFMPATALALGTAAAVAAIGHHRLEPVNTAPAANGTATSIPRTPQTAKATGADEPQVVRIVVIGHRSDRSKVAVAK